MTEMKPGAIVHVELSSSNPAATQKFLETVFGWKFKKEAADMGMEYWSWDAGSGPGGGLMKPMQGMPPGTLNYVLVESVDAATKKITAAGGKVVMPKQEIPKVGWFAVFEIPGGVMQAVYQPLAPR
ncbi:MAG: VOC family protein [Thermoplasmata archaeon]|nr:VOC family protein [Thermoplasmata archaeon]MCI4344185.1 VOC family protein [Thermoplasmata archaeon]